jgi:hypothetical protein
MPSTQSIAHSPTLTSERESQHAHEQADKAARLTRIKCDLCSRRFKTERALQQHRGDYHRKRLAKVETT